MSYAKIAHDIDQATDQEFVESLERTTPVTVKDMEGRNSLLVLCEMLSKWPPRDIRLEPSYIEELIISTDTPFMQAVARGMDTRISKRILSMNILYLDVLFQNNMAEFERYNTAVRQHNEAWEDAGEPEVLFDPVHGDTTRVRDKDISMAVAPSRFDVLPKSIFEDDSDGPLKKAKPRVRRGIGVTVQYRIETRDKKFVLEYVARDTKDRVLYYNRVENSNLTYLVRRSVQEVWGNPKEHGSRGAYLEGIPLLYQGRKLSICRADNKKPTILSGPYKDVTVALAVSKSAQGGLNGLTVLFGYIIPTIGVLGSLYFTLVCLAMWGAGGGPGGSGGLGSMGFLIGLVLIVTATYASTKLAGHLRQKAASMSIQDKFR